MMHLTICKPLFKTLDPPMDSWRHSCRFSPSTTLPSFPSECAAKEFFEIARRSVGPPVSGAKQPGNEDGLTSPTFAHK